MTGKNVKALGNKGGEVVSKIGRFMGLKLVDSQCLAQIIIEGSVYYCEPYNLSFSSQLNLVIFLMN